MGLENVLQILPVESASDEFQSFQSAICQPFEEIVSVMLTKIAQVVVRSMKHWTEAHPQLLEVRAAENNLSDGMMFASDALGLLLFDD